MTRLLIVTVLLATVAVVLALRNRNGVATRSLKVTARAGLSRNAAIVVVEVEGRRLLIGAAANSVNVLAELGPTPAADAHGDGESAVVDRHEIIRPELFRDELVRADRPAPSGGKAVDRLRSMTTRSFAPEASAKSSQGLV